MSPLQSHITALIRASGPLTLAEFMALCLQHPEHGYYTTRDPLGAGGDFTTAPEISQMFGELIGLCLAQTWLDMGAPAPFTLAELGPGRGTLMADILRATRGVAGFHAAAEIVLIETSPALRARQAEALAGYAPTWENTFAPKPQPLLLVANEFFDALPIRQFIRDEAGWRERVIGLEEGALAFGLTDATQLAALEHRLDDTEIGDLVEVCGPAEAVASEIGAHIADHGGCALIIDYGDWHSVGDTLQALQGHAPANPFANPGMADLTAHVDFEAIAKAATCFTRVTPQGVFLERLGITPRAQALAKGLTDAALEAHIQAHWRLTHPDAMGSLFKVIGLFPSNGIPPAGLET